MLNTLTPHMPLLHSGASDAIIPVKTGPEVKARPPGAHQPCTADDARRASLLTQLSIELRDIHEPEVIIDRTLRMLGAYLGATNAILILIEPDRAHGWGARMLNNVVQPLPFVLVHTLLERGTMGEVLRHGHSVVVPNVLSDRPEHPCTQAGRTGGAVVLPIEHAQRALGVLTVYHPDPGHLTDRNLALLEAAVDLVGEKVGTTRHQANGSEERRIEQAMALLILNYRLSIGRSTGALVATLQEQCPAIFDVDHSLLALRASPSTLRPSGLYSVAAAAFEGEALERAARLARRAMETGQMATDLDSNPKRPLAYLALPLVHRDAAIGAFVLIRAAPHTISYSVATWSLLSALITTVTAKCAEITDADASSRPHSLYTYSVERSSGEGSYTATLPPMPGEGSSKGKAINPRTFSHGN